MKKIKINIPAGVKYLSEVKGFELPNGIFNKSVTGCGATTLAIEDSNPTIICSPRVALIESKTSQHPNIFWYKFDTNDVELDDYIRSVDVPKIMVTFDSLWKLEEKLNINKFRVVVDEFQRLLTDSSFKSETEFKTLENLKSFKYVTYLSATPILDKYIEQIEIFDDVTYYEAVWSDTERVNILPYQTNTPERAIGRIIDTYKQGGVSFTGNDGSVFVSKEAVIYVNSVRVIVNAIKTHKLQPEDVNIIVAKNEKNEKAVKKAGSKFTIGSIPNKGEAHKKFTFCTSTAFDGVDMYSTNAASFVISNYKIDNLLMDIRTDLSQIAGRQRLDENVLRDTIVFFYSDGFDASKAVDYRRSIDLKLKETDIIVESRNRLKNEDLGAFERDLEDWGSRNDDNKYSQTYAMVYDGKFVTNKMLYLSEQYMIDLCVDFAENGIVMLVNKSDKFNAIDGSNYATFQDTIEISLINTVFEDKLRNYCELMDSGLVESAKVFDNESDDYKRFYSAFGTDGCRALNFRRTRLNRELKSLVKIESNDDIIAKGLSNLFTDSGVANSVLKVELQKIFDSLNIKKRATAKMVEEYLEVYSTKVNLNGKRVRGYKLEIHR